MPQTTKTFRVFVSFTFTDMRAERHILQTEVFPRLKALCESRGASFQDVDLHWTVNEEAQLDWVVEPQQRDITPFSAIEFPQPDGASWPCFRKLPPPSGLQTTQPRW